MRRLSTFLFELRLFRLWFKSSYLWIFCPPLPCILSLFLFVCTLSCCFNIWQARYSILALFLTHAHSFQLIFCAVIFSSSFLSLLLKHAYGLFILKLFFRYISLLVFLLLSIASLPPLISHARKLSLTIYRTLINLTVTLALTLTLLL